MNLELNRELLANDSMDVLVGTRFSSGPGVPAAVLNSKQYWVCDIKGYGPKMQIMFQSQTFILQFTG